MSQTIKLKRSAIAGKVPITSSLDLGEIAINTNDGKVFFKKDDGTESIQTIVTTDSLTTGSINISGSVTASTAQIASLNYPTTDGANGQVLKTDGAGNLSFSDVTGPITASAISASYIDLDVLANGDIPAHRPGRIFFGGEDGALEVYNEEADITLQVGQEFWIRVFNKSGAPILNGTPVRASGSQGDRIGVYPALAPDHSTEVSFDNHILGVATHDIGISEEGYVTAQGIVRGVDTSAFNAGDILYLQTGSAGLRNTPPPFPYDIVQVGYVARSDNPNGFVFVEPKEPVHFNNISGLSGSYTPDVGDLWVYQPNNAWTHTRTLSGSYTIDNGSLNVVGGVTGSSFTGSFVGDASELVNTRLFVSGVDLDSNNVETTFSKLQFDSGTGLYVSASDADTAFVFLGSHFRDIFVDGYPTLVATGSDQLDVIAGKGISISSSLSDTNSNSVSKELIFGIDGSVATTGSNTFIGDQTINGDLIVNGTGSFAVIQSVTGSAKIIGDAYIILNNNTPSERYAGIKVLDSGSAGVTASLEFDGESNDWFYQYSDDGGVTTDHGVVIFGPEYSTKGSPTYLGNNKVQKGTGGHHLADSTITDDGTDVTVGANLVVTGNITGSSNATFSGNVGIGTTSPQSSLHVDSNGTGATSNGITLRNSTNQLHYWYLEDNTTSVFDIGSVSGLYKFKAPVFFSSSIEVNDGNQLYFSGQSGDYASISFTDDDPDGWLFSYKQNSGQTAFLKFSSTSEAAGDGTITMGTTGNNFHINNGGNVGIGTTSPTGAKLVVAGDISGSGDLAIAGGTIGAYNFNNPGDAFIDDLTVTTLTETSTRELKDNIVELSSQSELIKELQPVTYTWKESGEEDFGLIAEDVEEIAPHLVTRNKEGKVNGIKYSKLSVLLLDVVQRQSTLIEDLNKRITILENERG